MRRKAAQGLRTGRFRRYFGVREGEDRRNSTEFDPGSGVVDEFPANRRGDRLPTGSGNRPNSRNQHHDSTAISKRTSIGTEESSDCGGGHEVTGRSGRSGRRMEPRAAQDSGKGGEQRNKNQHHALIQRVPERVAGNRSLDQERADERTGVDRSGSRLVKDRLQDFGGQAAPPRVSAHFAHDLRQGSPGQRCGAETQIDEDLQFPARLSRGRTVDCGHLGIHGNRDLFGHWGPSSGGARAFATIAPGPAGRRGARHAGGHGKLGGVDQRNGTGAAPRFRGPRPAPDSSRAPAAPDRPARGRQVRRPRPRTSGRCGPRC